MAGQAQIDARKRRRRQSRPTGNARDDFGRPVYVFQVVTRAGAVEGFVEFALTRSDVVGVNAAPAGRAQPFTDEADAGEELAERLFGIHTASPERKRRRFTTKTQRTQRKHREKNGF
jgi:hypothetical protein